MTREQQKHLQAAIEKHGLDYTLRYSESWRDIEDGPFQKLLTKYREAANFIEGYINDPGEYDFIQSITPTT